MPSPGAPSSVPPQDPLAETLIWDARPDAEELATLDAECFEPALSAAVYRHWLQFAYVSCWVVRAGAPPRTLGWAVCQRIEGEAEVLRLGVRPAWRGKGWGRALLRGLLDRLHADGAHRIFLEVRAGNAAAQALYRAAGFRETGRRSGYYANPPEDAVLMARESGTAP